MHTHTCMGHQSHMGHQSPVLGSPAFELVLTLILPPCSCRVVQYTLARHVPGCSLKACSHALDSALAPRHASLAQDLASSRSAEASLDKLSKQLRALDALVLKVVGVQPLGAAARGTALLVPGPHPLAGGPPLTHGSRMPRCVPAIEVLVQLENSGERFHWVDTLSLSTFPFALLL